MEPLKSKKCVPCEGEVEPLTSAQAATLHEQTPEWKISEDGKSISREFVSDDFAQALTFTNKVGTIAQEDWHHPDVRLSWGKVGITLSTHAIKGLSENDFIVAAKIDGLT